MAVPSLSPTDKETLRGAMREQRRAFARSLDPHTRGALEAALAEAVAPLFALARVIAGYAPMTHEISPLDALAEAAAAGRTITFPFFVDRDSRMTFRAGKAEDPGPWGILQPAAEAPIVTPDLVLVPLLAIDRAGTRIGMGKGHYDRALPGLRQAGARLIGVGWPMQLVDQPIPPDSWDVPLDGFASPDGLEMWA